LPVVAIDGHISPLTFEGAQKNFSGIYMTSIC